MREASLIGPYPEGGQTLTIKAAARDLRYLLDHGYSKEPSVRFVSDHHRLPAIDRFTLARVVLPSDVAEARRRKSVRPKYMAGRRIAVDGYNVIITTESLLSGEPVYRCDDGFLRDVRGIFRSYRHSQVTEGALSEILSLFNSVTPETVQVILDSQISGSGELAGEIRRAMRDLGVHGTAVTSRSADRELKIAGEVVATGDGSIIDAVPIAVDIPRAIARMRGIVPVRL